MKSATVHPSQVLGPHHRYSLSARTNIEEEIFGYLKQPFPTATTSPRMAYLWKKARSVAKTIGRINKILLDIQKYGGSRNHYANKIAWKESFEKLEVHSSKYMFHPYSNFKKIWSVITILLLLYTAIVVPYRTCFIEVTPTNWLVADSVIDALFAFDIFVNFNSSYMDEDQGLLIANRKVIAKSYLKGWFLIDLVACIPFQYFLDANNSGSDSSYNKLLRLARIPRLYRLIRIMRLFKMVRLFRNQVLFTKLINTLKVSGGILRLIKFGFTVMLVVHIVGCFWYYTAKLQDLTPDTWVVRYNMENSTEFELYLASIYWVVQTIATVGFGDISAKTPIERLFSIVLMCFGVGFYSYTVSNLSNIMATLDIRSSNLKNKLTALIEFSKATKLPEDLKSRIKKHIMHNHYDNIYSWFNQDQLIKELPGSLRREVSIHMHKKLVEQVIFFQDKDPNFLAYVVPKLKNIHLQSGEILYKEGDYPEEVYFLIKGRVNLKAANGIVFKTYIEGSYFGEVEILHNQLRTCTIQVSTQNADMVVLSRRDFLQVLHEFPDVELELRDIAKIRAKKNSSAKAHVLNITEDIVYNTKGWNRFKTNYIPRKSNPPDPLLFRKCMSYGKKKLELETRAETESKDLHSRWKSFKEAYCSKPAPLNSDHISMWEKRLGPAQDIQKLISEIEDRSQKSLNVCKTRCKLKYYSIDSSIKNPKANTHLFELEDLAHLQDYDTRKHIHLNEQINTQDTFTNIKLSSILQELNEEEQKSAFNLENVRTMLAGIDRDQDVILKRLRAIYANYN